MTTPLARFTADNGVEVEVRDATRAYGYADLFQVRLRVEARVPGEEAPYTRQLERLGVGAAELEGARAALLADFQRHALPYLLRPDFPEKWTAHRARAQARSQVIPFPSHP